MNVHLYHWQIKQSNLFTFCGRVKESYLHLFVYCTEVSKIWIAIEEFMYEYSQDEIHFDTDTVMWNRIIPTKVTHIKNFICLITKHYIYKQRCMGNKLNFYELKGEIIRIQNVE